MIQRFKNIVANCPIFILKIIYKKTKVLFHRFGRKDGQNKAQEILGEIATALIINLMGFEQAPSDWKWHSSHGPDQVAHLDYDDNPNTPDLWGMFEAKGGSSKLGKTQRGQQMGAKWMSHWWKNIIDRNRGPERDNLDQAFRRDKKMLAMVIRIDILGRRNHIDLEAQVYRPPRGNGMKKWDM